MVAGGRLSRVKVSTCALGPSGSRDRFAPCRSASAASGRREDKGANIKNLHCLACDPTAALRRQTCDLSGAPGRRQRQFHLVAFAGGEARAAKQSEQGLGFGAAVAGQDLADPGLVCRSHGGELGDAVAGQTHKAGATIARLGAPFDDLFRHQPVDDAGDVAVRTIR